MIKIRRSRGPGRRRAGRSGKKSELRRSSLRRSMLAAAAVGAVVVIFSSLSVYPRAIIGIAAAAGCLGVWKIARALEQSDIKVPLVPTLAGAVLMPVLVAIAGAEGLALGLLVTIVSAGVWRFGDGPLGIHRDLAATALLVLHVPFLMSFVVLLGQAVDGRWWILSTLLTVATCDAAGAAFLSTQEMTPAANRTVWSKRLFVSMLAAALGAAVSLWLTLHLSLWNGLIFGSSIAVATAVGRLPDSMIKRRLAIAVCCQMPPRLSGLAGYLRSALFAMPVAYVLLTQFATPT
jgi:phosphatidate cytidylyltransferase